MTYRTRTILRRLLPIVLWLLAVGVAIALPFLLNAFDLQLPTFNYYFGFLVAAIVMVVIHVLSHIDRHEPSAQENFQMALLLGIASYWLPTVIFLTIPCWIFVMTRFAFNLRSFLATIIGYAFVAIYAALFVYFGWIDNVWAEFFAPEHQWGWIPTGAVLIAWLASTIVRKSLRER